MNQYQKISRLFFKDPEGDPYSLTDGQSEIFRAIYEPSITRAFITSVTQYGKSDTASQAIITAAVERYEKIIIVAPYEKQASIIMNFVIGHIFDNDAIEKMLVIDEPIERLKRERSKKRLTFKNNSEIMILTANVRELNAQAKNLMGFGGTIIIQDEASLIPDELNSKILRMVGGQKQGKIVKLGNPFYRNHFYRSSVDALYTKVRIDKNQAIAEGRLQQSFVDEARANMPPMDFKIFYDVEFPEVGAEDSLIPYEWIQLAIDQDIRIDDDATKQSGLDVARFGRDNSVYTFRHGGKVFPQKIYSNMDTMALIGKVSEDIDNDDPEITAVDIVGIGSGVYDRLDEMGYSVASVGGGEKPLAESDQGKFFNVRAEMFWNLRELFRPEEGKSQISIPNDPDLIKELMELRYKYSSERKIRMEDKDIMKKRIGRSPDRADSLSLAFFPVESVGMDII